MTKAEEGISLLKSIPNMRDVGATCNDYQGDLRKTWNIPAAAAIVDRMNGKNPYMMTGMLFRGARPDEATEADRQLLLKRYEIKSIVDLRTKTEHIEAAKKRDAAVASSAAVPQSNDYVAEPLKIPGIKYHEINFNGNSFSWMLIKKLSLVQLFWLVALMLLGRRTEAIKRSLAPHMEAMGLIGLAKASLDVCKKEIRQFFEVVSDPMNVPVLVHCTQGKDRTGLTIMLLLFLLGVNVTSIEYDYLLSGPGLEAEKEDRLKEIASIGLSGHFTAAPPGFVAEVHEYIEHQYGGIESYLEGVGVDSEMRQWVRLIFLGR